MKTFRSRVLMAAASLLPLLSAPAAWAGEADSLDFNSKMLIQQYILSYVRNEYIDSLGTGELMDGAIEGMIGKLDPHSSYLPPKAADDFSERLQGGFAGIGITFAVVNETITVIDIVENGPSQTAGLRSRDRIVRIDGADARGLSTDEIRNRLRGAPGTKVTARIERPGAEKPFDTVIVRDWVEMNSVSHAYMIDGRTGYIALTRFSMKTASDVGDALAKLRARGMERLILDLRNNSGGVLDAAVGVANLFLPGGTIVYTQGRNPANNAIWRASGNAPYRDLPIVVMVNHGTASASEIVAGALQDHDRALVVGQTSFGKGLVMNPIRLQGPDRQHPGKSIPLGTFMLSVSRYYTPAGRLIQRPYTGSREEYINEGFDDIDPNAADSSREDKPVYHTDLGRNVYGGGGITPDITLPPLRSLNALERAIRGTNLCFEFADGYLLRHHDIPADFGVFLREYHLPEAEITAFGAFIRERGIHTDSLSTFREELMKITDKYEIPRENLAKMEDMLAADGVHPGRNLSENSRPFIERELKQEIARMVWGPEERYLVWHRDDTELARAAAVFGQAEALLAERVTIRKEPALP